MTHKIQCPIRQMKYGTNKTHDAIFNIQITLQTSLCMFTPTTWIQILQFISKLIFILILEILSYCLFELMVTTQVK